MNVLIAYATYSSSTQSASEILEDTLKEYEYNIERRNISDVSPDELGQHDMVFFGSPSWMIEHKDGQPHHLFLEFFKKAEGKQFPNTIFAIFGLGDTAYAHFCGAVDHMEEFVGNIKGVLIEPSLRIDGYYFNQEENNQKISEWIRTILKNLPPLEGRSSHL